MRVLLPGQIVVPSGEGAWLRADCSFKGRGIKLMTSPCAVCLIVAEKKTPVGLQWLLVTTEGMVGWLHSSRVRHVDDRPSLEAACRT